MCSVDTNCETGSWVYDSSIRLWKTSSSRYIFKGLKTRAGHDLVHQFEQKTVLGFEHKKTTNFLVTDEIQTGYSQMAGVQCECGAWDLVEGLAICVSSSWRSRSLTENES